MTMITRKDNRLFALVAALSIGFALAGCGSSPQPIDHTGEAARVDAATQMRALFDKSKGDFDSLSAEDKQKAVQLSEGKELNAKAAFAGMKNGPAAAQEVMRGGSGK